MPGPRYNTPAALQSGTELSSTAQILTSPGSSIPGEIAGFDAAAAPVASAMVVRVLCYQRKDVL